MLRLAITSLKRTEICPASAVLPETRRAFDDAQRGTALAAEAATNDDNAEVAFAYDVVTGAARELGRKLEPGKWPETSPTEVRGAVDRIEVEADRVVIEDDKSGIGFHVEPAATNLQLATYALAATRVHDKPGALVRLRFVDQDNRADQAELDVVDLAAVARRVRRIWDGAIKALSDLADGREPRVVAGDHCWRCQCFARCPAQVRLALTVATGKLPAELQVAELTRDVVAAGYPIVQQFRKVLGEVERAYLAFAANEPVPLGGGKWLGPVAKKRSELDGQVTQQVLRDMHGDEVAAVACEVSTSKAAIERALATLAVRGQKAAMVRAALGEIARRNGVTTKWSRGVDEYNEAPAVPAGAIE